MTEASKGVLIRPGIYCVRMRISLGTRLGLSVCLPVCLSVDAYSGTTGYEAAYELYKLVQIYKGLYFILTVFIFHCVCSSAYIIKQVFFKM